MIQRTRHFHASKATKVIVTPESTMYVFSVKNHMRSRACDMLTIDGEALRQALKTMSRTALRLSVAGKHADSYISVAITRNRINRKMAKLLQREGIPSAMYVKHDPMRRIPTMQSDGEKARFLANAIIRQAELAREMIK